ncbi:MAG: fused MFS/spermidine synthase [Deltaproteobacteria bacterium]|jgi:spermidine synthase|nr:fused MFS/spermidine synthase [Deltaproteobacteria bacterium]
MLEIVALLCGAAVMTLEMTGSRLLAPYLGASVLVWTALIGVILACLSAGYWLGGKLADRAPTARKLAGLILASAFCVLLTGAFQAGLLSSLAGLGLRPEIGASLAAIMLFGPASLLLGMVSPYVVRVAIQQRKTPVEKAGTLIGRFGALSALGSIIGTFLGGFIFISWVGSRLTVYLIAATLIAAAVITLISAGLKWRDGKLAFVMPLFALLTCGLLTLTQIVTQLAEAEAGLISVDTRYSRVDIYDAPQGFVPVTTDDAADPSAGQSNRTGLATRTIERKLRQLYTPPNLLQSAMFTDAPNQLALNYTKHYALAWQLRPQAERFLMLGGAGYSVPKYLLSTRKNIQLDVVEIDPDMTRLAHAYFGLQDDPRLTVRHEDARTYLNRYAAARAMNSSAPGGSGIQADAVIASRESLVAPGYQIIMGDTFSSAYNIPFQLATVECAEKIYAALDEDGVFISNIISAVSGEKSELLRSIHASFAQVFPEVRVFPLAVGNPTFPQNIMLVAFKTPARLPGAENLMAGGPLPWLAADHPEEARAELAAAAYMLRGEWKMRDTDALPPLRDDFAPVERYALSLLR